MTETVHKLNVPGDVHISSMGQVAYIVDPKAIPPSPLTDEQRRNATRWSMALRPVTLSTTRYPSTREQFWEHYWHVKHFFQCAAGLVKDECWRRKMKEMCHPKDQCVEGFDAETVPSVGDEVYWIKFDAWLSRCCEDLPQRGWELPFLLEKKIKPFRSIMETENRPQEARLIIMDSLMRQAKVFFEENPFEYHFKEFLLIMMDQCDFLAKLRGTKYPELIDYVKDKTPLPSHGNVAEYMGEVSRKMDSGMGGFGTTINLTSGRIF